MTNAFFAVSPRGGFDSPFPDLFAGWMGIGFETGVFFSGLAGIGILLGVLVSGLVNLLGGRPLPRLRFLTTVFLFTVGVPLLYYWEVIHGAAVWEGVFPDGAVITSVGVDWADLNVRFGVHLFLLVVMAAASAIDFEHYVIPDALTIPATILGVLLMTFFPTAALPDYELDPSGGLISFHPLSAFFGWSDDRFGFGATVLCVLFWIFALLDRRWFPRLGFRRAGLLFFRRLKESRLTVILPLIGLLGIVGVWVLYRLPAFAGQTEMKRALLSAVVGMAAGMTIVWGVRIIGRLVLGREAMGFGDVILVGVLGVFIGWQGAVLAFFLAPFAGLLFGILRALFRSEREIPYGPFLCLATLFLILFWPKILIQVHDFLVGPLAVAVLIAMGVVMVLLLLMIQGLKRLAEKFFR